MADPVVSDAEINDLLGQLDRQGGPLSLRAKVMLEALVHAYRAVVEREEVAERLQIGTNRQFEIAMRQASVAEAREAALREALRLFAMTNIRGPHMDTRQWHACIVCSGEWVSGAAEVHTSDCLAALGEPTP